MLNFLDDLLKGGDADKIAENHWADGKGIDINLPSGKTGDELEKILEHGWGNVKSDF